MIVTPDQVQNFKKKILKKCVAEFTNEFIEASVTSNIPTGIPFDIDPKILPDFFFQNMS